MADFRSQLKKLAGRTLQTLSRHRAFDVISVDTYEVALHLRSTGKKRRVPLVEIEPAWRHLRHHGRVTRTEIQERWSPRNPAYVAALLAALPAVTYTSKPVIRLYYREGI